MGRDLCFVDMDGVLVDFMGGILSLHSHTTQEIYKGEEEYGEWYVEKLLGVTPTEFWAPLNAKDSKSFWSTLKPLPECFRLINILEGRFGRDNIALLTSPSQDSGCIPGKKEWVRRFLPLYTSSMIFTSAKQFLGGPNRFLLDDKPSNLEGFRKFGGKGILIPRLWNSGWMEVDEVVEIVEMSI